MSAAAGQAAPEAAKGGRPRRVLYVIGSLHVGGAETHLLRLLSVLDRRRFEPVVCCFLKEGPLLPQVEALGVQVVDLQFSLGVGSKPRMVWDLLRAWGRLGAIIRGGDFALVHAYLFWANVLSGLALPWWRRPKFITSRRSLGHFKDGKPHHQWLENAVNRRTDLVLANAQGVVDDVVARERGIAKLGLIHNGVAPLARSSPPRPLPPGAFRIVVVANLIHYKGHDLLLEALAQLRATGHAQLEAHFVGSGRDEAAIRAQVERLGLGAQVHFEGSSSQVAAWLSAADLFVLPSREEGFSNALIEAMSLGLPVVVSGVGGNPEAVVHGESGWVFPSGDVAALAACIAEAIAKPEMAQARGQAAQARVAERFSLEAMGAAYEACYEALLGPA